MIFIKNIITTSLFLLSFAPFALSHELWLEGKPFRPQVGERMEIEIRNGENFEGVNLSFFNDRIKQFFWQQGNKKYSVQSRSGDIPAMTTMVQNSGLITVVYESTPQTISYTKWQKFVDFAKEKDLGDVLSYHNANGLPKTGFSERYQRYSKALIGAGHAQGKDNIIGLKTELVTLGNPYLLKDGNNLQVQLLYLNLPRTFAQIEVFERSTQGDVAMYKLRTDQYGIVQLTIKKGYDYLLNSVVLQEYQSDPEAGPLWESLWASLTFSVPVY